MIRNKMPSRVTPSMELLPHHRCNKIRSPEYFVPQHLQIMSLTVINGYPKRSVFGEKSVNNLLAVSHQAQPDGVL